MRIKSYEIRGILPGGGGLRTGARGAGREADRPVITSNASVSSNK